MSINRATLEGHLGADPEIRTTQSGGKVATFRIATTERWTDRQTGEKKERSQWHSIIVWPDWLIEVVEKKLKKGSRVLVEGQIETREWEKDGIKRYTTEIVVRGGASIILPVDMPRADRDRAPPPEDHRSGGGLPTADDTRTMQKPVGGRDSLDDDIPF